MSQAGWIGGVALLVLGALGCSKPEPINETHNGTLEAGDSTHPQDGSYYDEYKFKAAEGYAIVINMTSEPVDSYLHLRGPDGSDLKQNDDVEPGNLDARITMTAPESGEYTVLANSSTSGETGAYTLTIQTTPPPG